MTWQRIDENTYTDDTLVTCAEYQLFIDEMRDQGKYYQPDHWTSPQFAQGQAREPILGVRYSDAVVFCEWLTQREGDKWIYRLPLQKDVDCCLIKRVEKSPLGYWLGENNKFVWIVDAPEDARGRKIPNRGNLSEELMQVLNHTISKKRNSPLILDRERKFDRLLSDEFNDGTVAELNASRLDVELQGLLNREHVQDKNSRYATFFYTLTIFRDDIANRPNDFYLNRAFDFYVDLLTLQERIAGRSPAFEGIRLVKERIR